MVKKHFQDVCDVVESTFLDQQSQAPFFKKDVVLEPVAMKDKATLNPHFCGILFPTLVFVFFLLHIGQSLFLPGSFFAACEADVRAAGSCAGFGLPLLPCGASLGRREGLASGKEGPSLESKQPLRFIRLLF